MMNINEIKGKYAINTAIEAVEMIVGLGYDYDGFSNEKDLKGLIDELVELAVLAKSLMHVPTTDVEPMRHGHWVKVFPRRTGRNATYKCSVCKKLRSSYYNDVAKWDHCPCGAKMDGKENEK